MLQVQLRLWFPTADLGQLLSRRPSLLTWQEFDRIPTTRLQLLARSGRRRGSGFMQLRAGAQAAPGRRRSGVWRARVSVSPHASDPCTLAEANQSLL